MEYKTIFLIGLAVFFMGAVMTTVPVSAITQTNSGTQSSSQTNSQSGGVSTSNQFSKQSFSFNNNGVITSGCTKTVNGVSSPC